LNKVDKSKEQLGWETLILNPLVENVILFYLKVIAITIAIILMIILASCLISKMREKRCNLVNGKSCKHSLECKCPREMVVIN